MNSQNSSPVFTSKCEGTFLLKVFGFAFFPPANNTLMAAGCCDYQIHNPSMVEALAIFRKHSRLLKHKQDGGDFSSKLMHNPLFTIVNGHQQLQAIISVIRLFLANCNVVEERTSGFFKLFDSGRLGIEQSSSGPLVFVRIVNVWLCCRFKRFKCL